MFQNLFLTIIAAEIKIQKHQSCVSKRRPITALMPVKISTYLSLSTTSTNIAFMLANTLLLVRPAAFGFNPQTAASNGFQQAQTLSVAEVQNRVLLEFEEVVLTLQTAGIRLLVLDDTAYPPKPDAIFPNNWFSTHPDGSVFLYPMATPNRQAEVRIDWLNQLEQLGKKQAIALIDLRAIAVENQFLEGTGSLIIDPANQQLFMSRSIRSQEPLAQKVADTLGLKLFCFDAFDSSGNAIYHTNVLLAISPQLVIFCSEVVPDGPEKDSIFRALNTPDRVLLEINQKQMAEFAANVLFVTNDKGEKYGIISRLGWNSLTLGQQTVFSHFFTPICLDIPTIEQIGGGSARCMLAELF